MNSGVEKEVEFTLRKKVVELSLRKETQTMSEKNKHMHYEDRLEIQECLNKGMALKAIGQKIGKDTTTVSKEVKRHLKDYENCFVKSDEVCRKLLAAPYVCNDCEYRSRSSCRSHNHDLSTYLNGLLFHSTNRTA